MEGKYVFSEKPSIIAVRVKKYYHFVIDSAPFYLSECCVEKLNDLVQSYASKRDISGYGSPYGCTNFWSFERLLAEDITHFWHEVKNIFWLSRKPK